MKVNVWPVDHVLSHAHQEDHDHEKDPDPQDDHAHEKGLAHQDVLAPILAKEIPLM